MRCDLEHDCVSHVRGWSPRLTLACAQIERDRRDLQDYAVKYFNDPEETELSTCAEFAGILSVTKPFSCDMFLQISSSFFYKMDADL